MDISLSDILEKSIIAGAIIIISLIPVAKIWETVTRILPSRKTPKPDLRLHEVSHQDPVVIPVLPNMEMTKETIILIERLNAALYLMDMDLLCEGIFMDYIHINYDDGFCDFSGTSDGKGFRIELDENVLLPRSMDRSMKASVIWTRRSLLESKEPLVKIFGSKNIRMDICNFNAMIELPEVHEPINSIADAVDRTLDRMAESVRILTSSLW